ncbi:MAG: murein hydrolase activator EnvC family protein [Actinomycetota bacterium]
MPRRRFVAVVVLSGLLSTLAAPPAVARASRRSQNQRLQETRKELRAARSKLAALRRTDAQLLSVIRQVQRQLDSANGLLGEAKTTLAEIDARIRSHERAIARLSSERSKRDKALDRRVAMMYMLGPGVQTEALWTSGDFEEFVEKSNAFHFVLRQDRIAMEDLAKLTDRSRKARHALKVEAERAHEWRRRVSERVSLVWDALSTHKEAEDALASRIAEYRKEVRELEAEQRRIEDLIYSRGSVSTGPISLRGFSWPARGRRITSGYGRRWGGMHTGIDIDCSTGEGTYAAKAGRVIAAEWGGGYGRMVIIDHGNGVSSLYAHHSRLHVAEGRQIARGQRIGACGSTGNSSGSHLHFEIRVNGRHRNPRPYLP